MAFADRSSHLTRKVKVWKTSLWGTNQDHVEAIIVILCQFRCGVTGTQVLSMGA